MFDMKTTIHRIPESTIEAFAEKHGLEMEVRERGADRLSWTKRFSAKFKGVEVIGNHVLSSEFGGGDTPEEAIQAYAQSISEKLITPDGVSSNRREIKCPRFITKP